MSGEDEEVFEDEDEKIMRTRIRRSKKKKKMPRKECNRSEGRRCHHDISTWSRIFSTDSLSSRDKFVEMNVEKDHKK